MITAHDVQSARQGGDGGESLRERRAEAARPTEAPEVPTVDELVGKVNKADPADPGSRRVVAELRRRAEILQDLDPQIADLLREKANVLLARIQGYGMAKVEEPEVQKAQARKNQVMRDRVSEAEFRSPSEALKRSEEAIKRAASTPVTRQARHDQRLREWREMVETLKAEPGAESISRGVLWHTAAVLITDR